jgi:hypothetical protein
MRRQTAGDPGRQGPLLEPWRLLWTAAMLLAALPVPASGSVPVWLRQAASAPLPSDAARAPAAILFSEAEVRLGKDGARRTQRRHAVKILASEGREHAVAWVIYRSDTDKVRALRAWLVRPSGQVHVYGKKDLLDRELSEGAFYQDVRIQSLHAVREAEIGSVFGFESLVEERSDFRQLDWRFQDRLPVALSRLRLLLPKGWQLESFAFGRSGLEPAVQGSSYTWQLRDLPFLEAEPASPALPHLAPRAAMTFVPPAGSGAGLATAFRSWADVSRYLSALNDPQAQPGEAAAAKARELGAGTQGTWEAVKAIGSFVQRLRYVSIQTGLGRGGGYRPSPAAEVYARGYGDCKDKANLMRAMLGAVGIESHPVALWSGDAAYVQEAWPSPQQFNHAILAVRVPAEVEAPAVLEHPSLGRLLMFDPTNPYTQLGDLPGAQQGSLALVVAGDSGTLLRMPMAPPGSNRLERSVEAQLASDGSISAQIRQRASGQVAADARHEHETLSGSRYRQRIERWLARGATGASLTRIVPADGPDRGIFTLDIELSAPAYAQSMGEHSLILRPALVPARGLRLPKQPSRRLPVVLSAEDFTEQVLVELPEGFEVDELPTPARLETPFGRFHAEMRVHQGRLLYTRALLTPGAVVPAEQYDAVRRFFEQVERAEQMAVILVRR